MSAALPEAQLLELLVQLQKTTPDQAKAILNSQPQITYAIMPLMIKMDLVNQDILQNVVASHASTTSGVTPSNAVPAATPTPVPVSAPLSAQVPLPPPTPAIAPHLAQAQIPYHATPPPAQQHFQTVQPQTMQAHGYNNVPPSAPYAQQAQSTAGYPGNAPSGPGGYGMPPMQPQFQAQYGQQQQMPPQAAQRFAAPQQSSVPPPSAAPSAQPSFVDALGNVPDEQREMIMRVISMTPDQVNRLPPQERAITIQLRATLGLPTE